MALETPLFLLAAEDDENDAFFFQRALAKAHILDPVHIVKDGDIARRYLSGDGEYSDRKLHPLPDLLFLDIKMPKMTGLEVLRWAQKQDHLKEIPVLMLSSSSEEEDVRRAYNYGANAYVVKPISIEILGNELKRFYDFWRPYCHSSQSRRSNGDSG
jgi:CheY-like chemotaxis protein